VAKVAGMDAIEETKKRLIASLAEGQSMAQFIQSARASEVIQKGGFSKSTPWYWETVFRTNSIAAWNGGRFQQYREVADSIQDLQYVAILDRRTSDVCRSYNGITRPATDSIWQRITPPNHFNCRSTITAIWKGTMEAKRTARSTDENVANLPMPDDGFDSSIVDVRDFFNVPAKVTQKIFEYGLDDEIENYRQKRDTVVKENYYKPTEKQVKYINDLRNQAYQLIERGNELVAALNSKGKPKAAERIVNFMNVLKEQISKDETSIVGGDPSIWITISQSAIQNLKNQIERFSLSL
jgi:SPP1 gp7 family putative phage head morphogenesis protein